MNLIPATGVRPGGVGPPAYGVNYWSEWSFLLLATGAGVLLVGMEVGL